MDINIPSNHPRAKSLYVRELLVRGFKNGLVAPEGLIAQGRGESFDYLLGEKTSKVARISARAASSALLLAKCPVLSVNGNVAALCSNEIVDLSNIVSATIEVNLFYRNNNRERAIEKQLKESGAKIVLGVGSRASAIIPELQSERRRVDPNGLYKADTVLIPLEDGDRAKAFVNMGKTVIAIDLNPLSRTARSAQITIVDNIIRAIPRMIAAAKQLMDKNNKHLMERLVKEFDNRENLLESLRLIQGGIGARPRRY
jgi:4-phosphopantoate--beta-alanine ligase